MIDLYNLIHELQIKTGAKVTVNIDSTLNFLIFNFRYAPDKFQKAVLTRDFIEDFQGDFLEFILEVLDE